MSNKEPQYETMPEHYMLCFNDECALADECLHRLAARSGRQKDEVVTAVKWLRNKVRQDGRENGMAVVQSLCTDDTEDVYDCKTILKRI